MAAPTPRMHGLNHVIGGPDPIPGLGAGGGTLEWEDVGGPGVGTAAYAACTCSDLVFAGTGVEGILAFASTHLSGITASGGNLLTIGTSGTYSIMASGGVYVAPGAVARMGMALYINGTFATVPFIEVISPVAVPAGQFYVASMTLLGEKALSAGNTLQFKGSNNSTDTTAALRRWSVLVRQLL